MIDIEWLITLFFWTGRIMATFHCSGKNSLSDTLKGTKKGTAKIWAQFLTSKAWSLSELVVMLPLSCLIALKTSLQGTRCTSMLTRLENAKTPLNDNGLLIPGALYTVPKSGAKVSLVPSGWLKFIVLCCVMFLNQDFIVLNSLSVYIYYMYNVKSRESTKTKITR